MNAPAIGEKRTGWLGYLGWLAAVGALIALGYAVFYWFVASPAPVLSSLTLLAVVAGVASFFSPCAFPLLPSYLSVYYLAGSGEGAAAQPLSAFRRAAATTLGVLTFDLFLGALIGLLGAGLAQGLGVTGAQPNLFVLSLRFAVGVILVLLGVGQLAGWNFKPAFLEPILYRVRPRRDGQQSQSLALYLYGLGYTAAGMGCTGPILAGLVVFALASGGFTAAFGAFLLFTLTMAALMLLVSAIVAASRQSLVQRLKAAAPRIKSAASYLLIGVGLFNLWTVFQRGAFRDLLFP